MAKAFHLDPLDYPYDVPSHSFVWRAGESTPLPSAASFDGLTLGRHAVLAIGSNAAPTRLTEKFRDTQFMHPASPDGSIPVLTATVDDVDVVYGAHVAKSGPIPATLIDTPGACAHVFISWLTDMQLEHMDRTEGVGSSYQHGRMRRAWCHGYEMVGALSYVTVTGAAVLGGRPLGLASICALGSPWPRGTQTQAWDLLAADMHRDTDGKTFCSRVHGSSDLRREVKNHLRSTGRLQ